MLIHVLKRQEIKVLGVFVLQNLLALVSHIGIVGLKIFAIDRVMFYS